VQASAVMLCWLFPVICDPVYGRDVASGMIRALVFDFDGLILDTETPLLVSWREVYDEAGLALDERWWATVLGASADPPEAYETLEAQLGHPIDRARLWERHNARGREILATQDALPGVRETLATAEALGLKLAVASSSERAWVESLLAEKQLLRLFNAIVCMEDVRETKPAPDLYLEAVRRMEVRPSDAVAFEDSVNGVAAAVTAGLFCVAVPNDVTRHLDFSHAHLVLERVDKLPLQAILDRAEVSAS